jgi:hypothetical protein
MSYEDVSWLMEILLNVVDGRGVIGQVKTGDVGFLDGQAPAGIGSAASRADVQEVGRRDAHCAGGASRQQCCFGP